MLGNFSFCAPTRLHFGPEALGELEGELKSFGKNVLLIYGGGSVKRTGLYDEVMGILKKAGKNVAEDAGVMPNPTTEKLREGIERARAHKADLLLAVGGGSVVDYAKAVSASVHEKNDPWEKFYIRGEEPEAETLPVGVVLTMAGTGSEMNTGSVITNPPTKQKIGHVFASPMMAPRFAILNPKYTMTLPKKQMTAGIFDIASHIMEQYFSGDDDNTSDYLAEGLLRSLIHASRIAVKNPEDYEARSNIMWTATWALNSLLMKGKAGDWKVHMLGQAVGAVTNATHGLTLAAVSPAYYRFIEDAALAKLVRFAKNVWDVDGKGKSDKEIADAGLAALEDWMKEIGVHVTLSDIGGTEEQIPDMVRATLFFPSGYKEMTEKDAEAIFRASL